VIVAGTTGDGTGDRAAAGDDDGDCCEAQPEANTRRTAIEWYRRITGSGTKIEGPTRAKPRV
jgi:hypothetical protein